MVNPILPAALAACGLGLALLLALYLFCGLKAELHEVRRQAAAASDKDGEWKRRVEDLEARLVSAGTGREEPSPEVLPEVPQGLNLSRRSQVLRRARRGESAEQIAAGLSMATGEVRLMLKIQRILVGQALGPPPGAEALKAGAGSADIASSAGPASGGAARESGIQMKVADAK